jgi:uncharacterized protein
MFPKFSGLPGTATLIALLIPFAAAADLRVAEAVQHRDIATLRTLVRQKVDVNAAQPDGMTALLWAAHNDDIDAAALLVKAGADVKTANRYGVTPVTEAATLGDAAMMELLLKAGADPNSAPPEGDTALMLAAKAGSIACVKALLDHGADINARESLHGETALHSAAGENHSDVVQLLIDRGVDINAQARELKYPLVVRQDVMSLPPVGGLTPLMEAARENAFDAAKVLLKAKADSSLRTPDKMTALLIAITNAHWDMANLLIESGADLGDGSLSQVEEVRNTRTTLTRPASQGPETMTSLDIVKALLAHGAKADSILAGPVPTRSGGAGPGASDYAALYRAAKTADLEVLPLLLEKGADVKLASRDGSTALLAAAGVAPGGRGGGGNFGVGGKTTTVADRIKAIQMLIDRGADINAIDGSGQSAAHGAAGMGADEIIQYLFDHGGKLDVKDKRGRTPLDVANAVPLPGPPTQGPQLVKHESTAKLIRKLLGLPDESEKTSEIRPSDAKPAGSNPETVVAAQ